MSIFQLYVLIFHVAIATVIHVFVSRLLQAGPISDITSLHSSRYHADTECVVPSVENAGSLPGAGIRGPSTTSFSPRRATPNSGKKRRGTPNLSRTTASSSHGVKMATIFHDAAATMQEVTTPTPRISPNPTRLRMPASLIRSTPFGCTRHDDRSSPLGIKPPSSHGLRSGLDTGTVWRTPEASRKSVFTICRPFEDPPPDALSTNSGEKRTRSPSGRALTPPEVPFGLAFPPPLPFEEPPVNAEDVHINGREPISSGFSTPHQRYLSYPSSSSSRIVTNPTSEIPDEHRPLPRLPSPASDILDTHSSHGVPLVIPIPSTEYKENTHRSSIDTWLDTVLEASPDSTPEDHKSPPPLPPRSSAQSIQKSNSPIRYPVLRTVSHTSSNKENQSPPSPSRIPSPTRRSDLTFQNPHQTPYKTLPSPTRRFLHPLTPTNLLKKEPKRRKGVVGTPIVPVGNEMEGEGDFEIYDEVKELSPDVEMYRKGKGIGPKRERCASYWDGDIWPLGEKDDVEVEEVEAMCGRRVLYESAMSEELTKEKGFMEGVEKAEFEYRP